MSMVIDGSVGSSPVPKRPEGAPDGMVSPRQKVSRHEPSGMTGTTGVDVEKVAPPPLPSQRPGTASGNRVLSSAAVGSSASGFRPNTPNLLGRPLLTLADVEAAYEAIAVAQLRRSEFAAQAATLRAADPYTADAGEAAEEGDESDEGEEDGEEEDSTQRLSGTSADVLIVHHDDA